MRLEDRLGEQAGERFLVGRDLVLDRQDQRVWLAGKPLILGSKALALLEELMRHPQLLVSKERLFEAGWPGQAVSDAVLTTAIREIRRALDDPARNPSWIETQHGKGYRFLVPVEARAIHPTHSGNAELESSRTGDRRNRLIAAVLLGAVLLLGVLGWRYVSHSDGEAAVATGVASEPGQTLLAILPFESEGGEQWIADAFVSQIDNVLSQTDDIFVTDSGRDGRFGSTENAIGEARDAGIPQVLTGEVRQDAGRTIARLHLISTASAETIWEERFEGASRELLPMLETVSIAVARSLKPLTERDELATMAELGTNSVLALEEFEKGSRILEEIGSHASREQIAIAFMHLERALEHDPGFARAAYLLTSYRWGLFGSQFFDPATNIERAFETHLQLLDVAIVNAANETDSLLYKAEKANVSVKLKDTVRLLEEYVEHRPNDVEALFDLAAAYAKVGDWEGVGRATDRLAVLEMARGVTPVMSAYYFPHDAVRAEEWAARLAAPNTSDFEKSFAVDLYLVAGNKSAAYRVMDEIDRSAVSPVRRTLLRLQKLCADGQHRAGRNLAVEALANSDWRDGSVMAFVVMGAPDYDLTKVLPSDDTAAGRALISHYLFTPWFDVSQFPNLSAILENQGIEREAVSRVPLSCEV